MQRACVSQVVIRDVLHYIGYPVYIYEVYVTCVEKGIGVKRASFFSNHLGSVSIRDIEPCMLRIRIEVESPELVDEEGLRVPEVLALVRSGSIVQLVTGVNACNIALQMLSCVKDVSLAPCSQPIKNRQKQLCFRKACIANQSSNRETT